MTYLFEIGESVTVFKENSMVGQGEIVKICHLEEDLDDYFKENHPLYDFYCVTLQCQQPVYIVCFYHEMGQGGYTEKEIKKYHFT